MLKIPTELKIGAHQFQVIMEDVGDLEATQLGLTMRGRNAIILDASLSETQLEATFFHEILHCINSTLNHALLDSLSEQLYQVLKDNHLLNEQPSE